MLGGHRGEDGVEGDGDDGDEGDDSPSGQDRDVVMPVDGLPLPPDSHPGELQAHSQPVAAGD